MKQPFIIDAHLDLGMNAMEWNRDLRISIDELNSREQGMADKPDRGQATVTFDELRKGNIGLVVATQIARYVTPHSPLPGWLSPQQAWAQTQGQLAWYKTMEDDGHLKQITTAKRLKEHLRYWNDDNSNENKAIGYILSLEGADSLINISYLEKAYNYGLRALGPAHYGPGRYANGTDGSGRLNTMGVELLKEMDRLNMILDMTHLNDDAFWHALEVFNGNIWASHNNCRVFVDHNRQFSNEMIQAILERDGVIGVALDAWMMVPNWVRGTSTPEGTNCNLKIIANNIDHICQLAGNTNHVGIGSDLDGAFGKEQIPYDLDTIADLQKILKILSERGYKEEDIDKIAHQNWIDFMLRALP